MMYLESKVIILTEAFIRETKIQPEIFEIETNIIVDTILEVD